MGIRSDDLTIINIPPEIAKDLIDKQFDTFDELKVEIYKKIGNSKYANEFILGNQKAMESGKTPFAPVSLQTGKNLLLFTANVIYLSRFLLKIRNLLFPTPNSKNIKKT